MPQTRGRRQTLAGNRFSGREMRAPRRKGGPGRPRTSPDAPQKPVEEMTPDERKAYRAAQARARRSDARAQAKLLAEMDRGMRRYYPTRIYAPNDEAAQRIGGPNAVAVKRVTVIVPISTWERAKRVACGIHSLGFPVDTSLLLSGNLESTLDTFEQIYNNGEEFTEESFDFRSKVKSFDPNKLFPAKKSGSKK